MKIGLSYSRCVLDIVEGRVSINDVLVIVARTHFDPTDSAQWSGIWAGYRGGSFYGTEMEWSESKHSEAEFRTTSIELLQSGRLHQPRQFGARPPRLPWHWLDTVLVPEDMAKNSAVKDAWDKFQTVSGLTGIGFRPDPHAFS